MNSNPKTFAIFSNGEVQLFTVFRLFSNSYIKIENNEPCPIEDYGNWMLFNTFVTEEEAFAKFLDKINIK